eukprot:GHVS01033196.1.p1 GENE.GHVS01033196.1~~GHVS01033196.1.p1  ORF type:complete len:438 (-),score=132.09 GHVS01033196.1:668-1981(-)
MFVLATARRCVSGRWKIVESRVGWEEGWKVVARRREWEEGSWVVGRRRWCSSGRGGGKVERTQEEGGLNREAQERKQKEEGEQREMMKKKEEEEEREMMKKKEEEEEREMMKKKETEPNHQNCKDNSGMVQVSTNGMADRAIQSTEDTSGRSSRAEEELSSSRDNSGGGLWSVARAAGVVVGGVTLLYSFYVLHKYDYSMGKAELHMHRNWLKLCYGKDSPSEALLNSQFRTSLGVDEEIAKYFIQLDADKSNGVRRSDAVDLVQEEMEVDLSTSVAKNDFINRGKGRTLESKTLSGCSLQEFASFLEAIYLEGEDREAFVSKLNAKLKQLNKTAASLPTSAWTSALSGPPVIGGYREEGNKLQEDEAEEEEMIDLEIEALAKLKQQLRNLRQRRQLSEAESERLSQVEETHKQLERDKTQAKQRRRIAEMDEKLQQ